MHYVKFITEKCVENIIILLIATRLVLPGSLALLQSQTTPTITRSSLELPSITENTLVSSFGLPQTSTSSLANTDKTYYRIPITTNIL